MDMVVTRTYNGARHNECPPTSSRIGLDCLHDSHIKLDLLRIDSSRAIVIGLLVGIVDGAIVVGGVGLDLGRVDRLL